MPRVIAVAAACLVALILGMAAPSLRAEGLKSAQVSRIYNDVKLLPENQAPRPAAVADVVTGKAAVQTGAASRTELMFSDRTLTRLGANSFFSFVNGTRDMNLGSGTMLLQVPKGAGGAEIHTAAVTAAITGTTLMVEFNPKSYSKIVVLEGTVRVFLTKRIGESVLVHAGQMVIVGPGAASLPEPVGVDLKVLYATSGLINDFGPLASTGLIDREIGRQRKDIDDGRLADTNLFIVGRGTEVQQGHLSFVSGNDHSITARQGPHTPFGLSETPRLTTNPPPPPSTPIPPTPVPPTPIPPTPVPPTPVPPTPVPPTPVPPTPVPPTPVPPTPVPPTPVPPTPSPSPSKFGPLPLIANNAGGAYAVDATTAIATDPFITTRGVTDAGRIYRGGTTANPATASSVDGLPSNYFLGAATGPSSFDTQIGFDTQFGTLGYVGGFKFSNLGLIGNPASISTAGGPTHLIFVATGNINDSAPGSNVYGSTFDLRGLDNVAFVTQNGAITFGNGLTFTNSGATATTLTLYARGGTLYNDNATFNLPGSTLNLYSDTEVISYGSIGSTGSAGAALVNFVSGGTLTLGGVVNASGTVNATTTPDGAGDLNLIASGQIITGGDFNATSGGAISALGTIDSTGDTRLVAANGLGVTGNITTVGNLRLKANAGDVMTDASNLLSVGGIFTAYAAAGNLTLNGTVGADQANPTLTNPTDANLSASGNLTLNGDLAATNTVTIASAGGNITQAEGEMLQTNNGDIAVTANGGAVLIAGQITSGGSISLSAGGALTLQGASLASADGKNVSLASSLNNVTLDANTIVTMNGGVFSANAHETLEIDGSIGIIYGFGEGGYRGSRVRFARSPRADFPGISGPDYATGVAGNGIILNGSIITTGTGGGSQGTDGMNFTANGGDFNVGDNARLDTVGGDITFLASQGAMTLRGAVESLDNNAFLTSSGDLEIYGFVYAAQAVTAHSDAALTVRGDASVYAAENDATLSSNGTMTIEGQVTAGQGNANLHTASDLSINGNVSAGQAFSLTSDASTITLSGNATASGPFGTVSTVLATDLIHGAIAVSGTINVGAGEVDFHAGTTFDNDPFNSSITATTVNITAGTVATVQLSRFHYGGDEDPALMNVTAATIFASTDPEGNEELYPLNLTATGAITLTGNVGVETLLGANLTVSPNSAVAILNLNLVGPTGAFVIGNGSSFQLDADSSNANAVGAITLDGSPSVALFSSLAVAGGISTTSANQSPSLLVSEGATLTATGAIALGAGSLEGDSGTTITTNGTLTTTGGASASTLNVNGGFTVGTLSAGTLTLQDVNGNVPSNPPASVVSGNVSAYRFDSSEVNTFTLGQLTAGALQFAGVTGLGANNDGYSLTLNVTGNFGVGGNGSTGYVTGGDFSGGALPANSTVYNGQSAGPGGAFVVTTLANAATGTAGDIRIQDNGSGVAPFLTANGGAFAPTANGITGTGGAGGKLSFRTAGIINVGNTVTGASLTAAGGQFAIAGGTFYTGGGATNGGAGGTIAFNAGTTLNVMGAAGTGNTLLNARGGDVIRSNSGHGGRGGTINLRAGGAVTLLNTQIDARGGDDSSGTIAGDAPGGAINVTSIGAGTAGVSITNASLLASNGVAGTQQVGTGGGINIAASTPVPSPSPSSSPSPTPATTILFNNSKVIASQEQPSNTPGYGSRVGGVINVTNNATSGVGISVQNGTQLLALVNSSSTAGGGTITLQTSGADIAFIGPPPAPSASPSATPYPSPTPTVVRASGPNSAVTVSTGGSGVGSINVNNATLSTADFNGTLTAGGTVSLTAGSTINVGNGSLITGNVVSLQAAGNNGSVTIDDSGFVPTRLNAVTLTLQAPGSSGAITLGSTLNTNSVTLNADLLKIFANGTNGAIVINAGSTLSATTQLKLYANGTGGSITFQGGNITLSTGSLAAVLAANTITINTGTVVTVSGSTPSIYTNHPNYGTASGGTGTGQTGLFENGAGTVIVTTPQPLNAAPTASAIKGGQPVRAVSTGSRVVASGPGFVLVVTRAPAAAGPALPEGFTRQGVSGAGNAAAGKSAAGLRQRPTLLKPVRRPGAEVPR